MPLARMPVRISAVLAVVATMVGCGQNAATLHHEIADQTVLDQANTDATVVEQQKHVVAISYKYPSRARSAGLKVDSE